MENDKNDKTLPVDNRVSYDTFLTIFLAIILMFFCLKQYNLQTGRG